MMIVHAGFTQENRRKRTHKVCKNYLGVFTKTKNHLPVMYEQKINM